MSLLDEFHPEQSISVYSQSKIQTIGLKLYKLFLFIE